MIKRNILITGGCRSGKSRHALSLSNDHPGRKVYLATAESLDKEMAKRIAKHKKERGKNWVTIEEPIDIASVIAREDNKSELIVLDCLTLWVSNLLMEDLSATNIIKRVKQLIKICTESKATIALITNEVGGGIVPDNRLARDFRDISGESNQLIAKAFDEVVHMVSGIPVIIKNKCVSPDPKSIDSDSQQIFSKEKREGVYEAIYKRRDMRHFLKDPIDPTVLGRILDAAHHAGSVGYMQPWNFIVINEADVKLRIADIFSRANAKAAQKFDGDRKSLYNSLKLEGITDSPINICITCDRTRFGPNVLGRDTIPETDIFSTCCAVQNLWLAARAEGLAVGWVSILYPEELKQILKVPEHIFPVAYLCIGHTKTFYDKPMLETAGWAKRLNLKELIFYDKWQGAPKDFHIKLHNE
jgi:5,6-dimethylbenzimidazole synthase